MFPRPKNTVGPVRFELTTPRLKAGYIFPLSYEPLLLRELIVRPLDSNQKQFPYAYLPEREEENHVTLTPGRIDFDELFNLNTLVFLEMHDTSFT